MGGSKDRNKEQQDDEQELKQRKQLKEAGQNKTHSKSTAEAAKTANPANSAAEGEFTHRIENSRRSCHFSSLSSSSSCAVLPVFGALAAAAAGPCVVPWCARPMPMIPRDTAPPKPLLFRCVGLPLDCTCLACTAIMEHSLRALFVVRLFCSISLTGTCGSSSTATFNQHASFR